MPRKILRSALAVLVLAGTVAAQPVLYTVSSRDDLLRTVDPDTAATLGSVAITVPGETVTGATGLATDPSTQTLYAILKLQGYSTRVLATVDPATGAATVVGDTGLNLAGIVFDDQGRLWAVTGDGGSPPETLFTLDPATGTPTQVLALGRGDDGETIGFNPRDGLLYHASGHIGDYNPATGSGVIFESIGPDTLVVTDIPIAGTALTDEEAQAIVWWDDQGVFLWKQDHTSDAPLYRVTTSGVPTLIGNLDHQAKGMAFVPTVYPRVGTGIPATGGLGAGLLVVLMAVAGLIAVRRAA